jgi:hypothetical protein
MKRGKPFEIGNKFGKGRPLGSPNKVTDEARKLLDDHRLPLIRTCLAAALRGDMKAMSMLLERLVPLRRHPTPNLKLPRLETSENVAQSYEKIVRAVSQGDLQPAEAQALLDVLKARLEMMALQNVESRLLELELLQQKKAA